MRHFMSFGAGLVLAPVVWFLAALGEYRLLAALPRGAAAGGASKELLLGAALLLAGGVWLGILLGTRISPAGPVAAGVLWLGAGAAFIWDPAKLSAALPDGPSGQQGLLTLPLEHGYAFLVGAALLLPLGSKARWRGRESGADEEPLSPYGEPTAVARHDTSHLRPVSGPAAEDRGWPGAGQGTPARERPAPARAERPGWPAGGATGAYPAASHTGSFPAAEPRGWPADDGTGQQPRVRHDGPGAGARHWNQ
jgi:hypothetical protein